MPLGSDLDTIRDDSAVLPLNGLVGDSFREVDGEQD